VNDDRRPKVLLVDDNRHLRVTLTDFLGFEGFDVEAAKSGEEALKKIEAAAPDIIVLDISMPGMGGLGFLRRISDPNGLPTYPVLVLTARSSMEEFFDTVTVDGFLPKPCSETELIRRIREILALRGLRKRQEDAAVADGLRRVLIAENDETVSDYIIRVLEGAGFITELVTSGPAALEKAGNLKPDLIILKQLLPGMNGNVVASLIATMPSTKGVPIILYDDTSTAGSSPHVPSGVDRFLCSNDAAALLRAANQLMAG
jgi:CheY-like chemotaxis protein